MKKKIVWACLAGLLSGSVFGAGNLYVNFGSHVSGCDLYYYAWGRQQQEGLSEGGLVSGNADLSNTMTVSNVVVASGYALKVVVLDASDPVGPSASSTTTNTLSASGGAYSYTGRYARGTVTFYLQTTLITNTITYVVNGGALPDGSPTAYTVESATITLPTPTRNGYDFGGWYENSNYEGAAATEIPNGSLGNRTFYAKWIPAIYDVTLHLNGGWINVNGEHVGGETFVTNYAYGVGLTLPTFGKEGHAPDGWRPDAQCLEPAVSSIGSTAMGACEFWAKFTSSTYTLTLDNQGADISGTKSVSVQYDGLPPAITCPERYGYDFVGYFAQTGGEGTQYYKADGTARGNAWETTSDGILYAHWLPHSYELSFNAGEGGVGSMDSMALTYGVETNLPPVGFVREGHVFAGWRTNATAGVVFADGQMVSNLTTAANGMVTMTATWTPGRYFVAFNANGGEGTMDVQEFSYGIGAKLHTNVFTHAGYDFAGWAWSSSATKDDVDYVDGQMVTNIVDGLDVTNTLYAVWKAEEYEVMLYANEERGGYFLDDGLQTNSISATVAYGEGYDRLPVPSNTIARMSFAGWRYVDPVSGTTNALPPNATVPLKSAGVTQYVAQWMDGLAAALNAPGTVLEYETGEINGNHGLQWTPVEKDGEMVAEGVVLPAKASWTYIRTVLSDPGVLNFKWRIYAPKAWYDEGYGVLYGNYLQVKYDESYGTLYGNYLQVEDDGEDKFVLLSGDDMDSNEWVDSGWQDCSITITNAAESMTVEWIFGFKNGMKSGGGTGWVDNVTWTPAGSLRPGKVPLGPDGSSPMTVSNGQTSVYVTNTVQGWWYGLYSKTNLADTAEEWTILPSSAEYPTAKKATADDEPVSFAWPWNLSTDPQRFFKIILTPTNPCP